MAAHHHDHHTHFHGDDDPFLGEEGAAMWRKWMPIIETGTRHVADALLDATAIGPDTRTLDLACGLGAVACAAADRGATATGLDLNPHMIAHAPDCGADFIVGDMQDPPAGPWDAIVSRFGAHHAPPGWLDAAVRVLAPGGRIAIAEWHPDTALFDVETDEPLPTEDTADDWAARFEAAGLTDVTTTGVDFDIDFGDDATWDAFIQEMGHGTPNQGLVDGHQANRAYIVSGRRPDSA